MTTPRPAQVPGLLLRLTGPLQSWGEHSHFNDRDTLPFPSRSALTGLLAAALGRQRHHSLDDLNLSITVRADRPGNHLRDFHTVGGGLAGDRTVVTADGKRRDSDTSTLTSTRWYLQDAAFTVALTLPDHAQPPTAWANALQFPRWPLYLGRRSCPPAGPLLLGRSTDALHDLFHLPLALPAPRTAATHGNDSEHGTIPVLFLSDQPLIGLSVPTNHTGSDSDAGQEHSTVLDVPVDFASRHRRYRVRPLYRRTLALPTSHCAGYGTDQLAKLAAYTSPTFTPAAHLAPEGSIQ
ncbi:type I-E CRISPR-associated protein Cas5/CasD [Streptomyces sp. NPDC047028]|uniref:type I-E CRISPR-associated protein Cas5/CasD n=1 Tax=Streptomyces sp. NPDC047028 TaxID=3155793 RepID=UPI0033D1E727